MKTSLRMIKIFEILSKENPISIRDISSQLRLTEREVRYDLDTIDLFLTSFDNTVIQKDVEGKLFLNLASQDKEKLYDVFKSLMKVTIQDRRKYLKLKIILEGRINISKEANLIDVSRATIGKDLNIINEKLQMINSSIVNHRINVDSEAVLRKQIFSEYSSDFLSVILMNSEKTLTQSYIRNFSKKIDVKRYLYEIKKIIDPNNNKDIGYLLVEIMILLLRNLKKNQLNVVSENKEFAKYSMSFRSVKKKIKELNKTCNISLYNNDLDYLSEVVLDEISPNYMKNLLISVEKTSEYLEEKVAVFADYFSLETLKNDKILFQGLLSHITDLEERILHESLKNSEIYLETIDNNEKDLNFIKENFYDLEEFLHKEIVSEEFTFLAIHVLAAVERNNENRNCGEQKKKVILVCNGGYGTTEIIRSILEKNYSLQILEILSLLEIDSYDFSKTDYVISTIELVEEERKIIHVPVIQITPFFSEEDQKRLLSSGIKKLETSKYQIGKILDIVQRNSSNANLEKINDELVTLFSKKDETVYSKKAIFLTSENVKVFKEETDWENALLMGVDGLGLTDRELERNCFSYLKDTTLHYGPYYLLKNNVAIPHVNVSRRFNSSMVSLIYFTKGVEFPEGKVVNLMFTVAIHDKREAKSIIGAINQISRNNCLQQEIVGVETNQDLIDWMNRVLE